MIDINRIRDLNSPEHIAVTKHAKDRMLEREISLDDIIACIQEGNVIKQYEDDKPYPSCLIVGLDVGKRALHVVVSNDQEYIYLITAYHPDPSKWDSDLKSRKEK